MDTASFMHPIALALVTVGACGSPSDVYQTREAIIGGTTAAPGEFEAVAHVGNATGTLITPFAILTSAHVLCKPSPVACYETMEGTTHSIDFTFMPGPVFEDVIPAGGGPRVDVRVAGKIYIHRAFTYEDPNPTIEGDEIVAKDYAIVRLYDPATGEFLRIEDFAEIEPIPVAGDSVWMTEEDLYTVVGYGITCGSSQKTYAQIQANNSLLIQNEGMVNETTYLHFDDPDFGACKGDSGGPAISTVFPAVLGVASVSSESVAPFTPPYQSSYAYTPTEIDWIAKYKCPEVDPASPDPDFCSYLGCPCYAAEGNCHNSWECVPMGGLECVPDTGAKANLPASYDLCWSPTVAVKLFDFENGGPPSRSIVEGQWTSFSPLASDAISSLEIPGGYAVDVCTSSSCARFIRDVNLPADSNNKAITSITVTGGTTFQSSKNSWAESTWRGNGSYSNSDIVAELGEFAKVDGFVIAPGYVLEYCSAPTTCSHKFVKAEVFGGAAPSFWGVRAGITVYSGRGFTGKIDGFKPGTWVTADLVGMGPDEITSLVVAPEMEATICWNQDCANYTGWVAHVGIDFVDRRMTSIDVHPAQLP